VGGQAGGCLYRSTPTYPEDQMYGLSVVNSMNSLKGPMATPSRPPRAQRSRPIRVRVLALRASARHRTDLAASHGVTPNTGRA
jgi:hypothetical protein